MSRLVRIYTVVAVQLLNAVLVFAAINVAIVVVQLVRERTRAVPAGAPVVAGVDFAAYTAMSREQVRQFLGEQAAMQMAGFRYEPWVLFRNPEYHGQLLNTNAAGVRRTRASRAQCADPIRVFVFGGSTTFGYGVADNFTIPSHLQGHLERRYPAQCVQVSNYGQGYFFSSQEFLQFSNLLKAGHVPAWAIFFDGANDTYQLSGRRDVPFFSDAVQSLWEMRHRGRSCPLVDWSWLPVYHVAGAIRQHIWGAPLPNPRSDYPTPVPDAERSGAYVAERYKHNVRMIRALCAEYHVQCRFVWQPTFFDYDRALHPAFPYAGQVPEFWREAYERVRAWKANDVLYLGDLFRGVREKVFVDNVHYNERWNGEIASRIADVVDLGTPAGARPRL